MARRRDFRAEYQRRLASGIARGLTTRQARGHPGRGEVLASAEQQVRNAPKLAARYIQRLLGLGGDEAAAIREASQLPPNLRRIFIEAAGVNFQAPPTAGPRDKDIWYFQGPRGWLEALRTAARDYVDPGAVLPGNQLGVGRNQEIRIRRAQVLGFVDRSELRGDLGLPAAGRQGSDIFLGGVGYAGAAEGT